MIVQIILNLEKGTTAVDLHLIFIKCLCNSRLYKIKLSVNNIREHTVHLQNVLNSCFTKLIIQVPLRQKTSGHWRWDMFSV